jgi:hypothetical protein
MQEIRPVTLSFHAFALQSIKKYFVNSILVVTLGRQCPQSLLTMFKFTGNEEERRIKLFTPST